MVWLLSSQEHLSFRCGLEKPQSDAMSRIEADWWSLADVGRMQGRVWPLCEGWWNRSDISPELQREIPAGTEQRGGIREEGENGERCDP